MTYIFFGSCLGKVQQCQVSSCRICIGLRANHANFMTKQLRKAMMRRSKLLNNFLKDRNDAFQRAYTENNTTYL